jgi:hypothetical protein
MTTWQRVDDYLEGCDMDDDIQGFRVWLRALDAECLKRFDVSVFDLEDVLWRAHFDSGLSPLDAFDHELEAGSFPMLEEYGEDEDEHADW